MYVFSWRILHIQWCLYFPIYTRIVTFFVPWIGCHCFLQNTDTLLRVDCYPLQRYPKNLDTTHCSYSAIPHDHLPWTPTPYLIILFSVCNWISSHFSDLNVNSSIEMSTKNYAIVTWTFDRVATLQPQTKTKFARDSWTLRISRPLRFLEKVCLLSWIWGEPCRDRQQEDSIIYRHVSTIRVMYLLQYLWCFILHFQWTM